MSEVISHLPQEEVSGSDRFNDSELLELRLTEFQSLVLHSIMSSDAYQGMSDWQKEVTDKLHTKLQPEQTIDLPTRTGKSYLLREYASSAAEHGLKSVIVAPRQRILSEHASELAEKGLLSSPLSFNPDENTDSMISYTSVQSIAVNRDADPSATEDYDLVLIDEVHKAIGEKTLEGIRNFFPNAVFISFTATPDYAENRSVTSEHGEKIISKSIVEAIKEGRVPPVRALLFKTDAVIENLDPSFSDFTARELARLAQLNARNKVIVETATDLVSNGRQGLITTIPGKDLLHAELLKEQLISQEITLPDGTTRKIRAEVIRGNQPDKDEIIDNYNEYGDPDILLYCDVLREGTKLTNASFLINGRPTTSTVNLTQDIGRILEPKDGDMIVVDFKDESVKHQRTVFDILELDRATQGVLVSPNSNGENEHGARDNYLRGIFRPGLIEALNKIDNTLLHELIYRPGGMTPYEKLRQKRIEDARKEEIKQTRIWEQKLRKEGLGTDQLDMLMADTSLKGVEEGTEESSGDLIIDISQRWPVNKDKAANIWPGFDSMVAVVPVEPISPRKIEKKAERIAINETDEDPQNSPDIIDKIDFNNLLEDHDYLLTDKEREVLYLRYGLDGTGEPKFLQEIADKYGVTRERIRQLENNALKLIRRSINNQVQAYNYSNLRKMQARRPRRVYESVQIDTEDRRPNIVKNRKLVKTLNQQFDDLEKIFKGNDKWSTGSSEVEAGLEITRQIMKKLGLDPNSLELRGALLEQIKSDQNSDRNFLSEEYAKELLKKQTRLLDIKYGRTYHIENTEVLGGEIAEMINEIANRINFNIYKRKRDLLT